MKILLFGASLGGQNFIKNHANVYEILAVIDNDSNKQGKLLDNIEIIHPSEINNYNYDKIIVASMFVDSISKQLAELGVAKDKIEFASKNSMKIDSFPFENPQILERTNRLMIEISKALKEIPHFYTFGTLLGIVRDGRLISWDDDIDIAIFADDFQLVKDALVRSVEKFESLFEIKILLRIYSNGNPASITIDCFEQGKKLFMVNFDCIYIEGNVAKQELNDTPLHFFEGNDELLFFNTSIPVPQNYKSYLDYTYGDWHIVKKNTSFADNAVSFREPLYSCTIEYLYETV